MEFYITKTLTGYRHIVQFEAGMTWKDWSSSKYDTLGAYVDGNNKIILEDYTIHTSDDVEVISTDVIVANGEYKYRGTK